MKTRAAVVEMKDGPFVFRDIEMDAPRSGEIVVRVAATGICHTDAHIRSQGYETPLPFVLGHEGVGVVENVGSDVTTVAPGDRVILSFPSCGRCNHCLGGHPAYCDDNLRLSFGGARLDGSNAYHGVHGHFFGQSSFATYSIANERNTVKVADDVPLELLGPLGCGLQTGAGAVLNSLQVPTGASIVVLGAGAVGLAAVMAARVAGADPIVAVDIHDERLELARSLGATHVVNGKREDTRARILEITRRGANYIVDLTGSPKMLGMAVEALAPTGTAALVGAAHHGTQASIDMASLLNGRIVRGVVQGDAVPQLFIPKLIALYRAGKFPFDRLIRFYEFEDIERAFEDSKQGRTIKPVLRIAKH
ncbi:MAG: NAD(P)-dependent alcohol dehydrogenase [Deltaproteobacteria bacterium]|nr:NAD(P)-dependent alcohol dehydrogenase [Deltaproteobacteria bacterium]